MSIINQLKQHETEQLASWEVYTEKETRKFLREIAQYAKENPDEIKTYCLNTVPTSSSSLSIVYQALSTFTYGFDLFLFEEIKRIVSLVKNGTIATENLEVLIEIDVEYIYYKALHIFIAILDFLTSQLHIENKKDLNLELLGVIEWYLIELEEDDEIPQTQVWKDRISTLAENSKGSLRTKCRELLEDLDIHEAMDSPSFFDRIKDLF